VAVVGGSLEIAILYFIATPIAIVFKITT